MSYLDDIRSWVISTSSGNGYIGQGSTYPCYVGKEPASTANMHILYTYAGMAPERIADAYIDKPRFQVKTVSAASSDNGYNAALTIQNRLRFVCNRTIPTSSGTQFIEIYPLASPESIGADENGRMQWIQNFQVQFTY
jgi:hypothetical protein